MVPNYTPKAHSTTTAIVLCVVPLLYIVLKKVLHRLSAPIRQLPGPKSVNWLTGSHERHVWEPDAQDAQLEWTQKYGPVFRYYGMFNTAVIITTDLQALNYILNAPEFDKPYSDRQFLGQLTGKGLLFVEGSQHRQQSPAFGLPQIKEFSQLFIEKANELRDALIAETAQVHAPDGSLKVDIYLWLNKTTLDIIGHAGDGGFIITVPLEVNMPTLPGFNHAFGSLHQAGPPEMSEWLRKATAFNPFSLKFMFTAMFPPARIIVCHSTLIVMEPMCLTCHQPTDRNRAIASMHKCFRSIGQNVISRKKAEILSSSEIDSKGRVEKKNIQGRDLLSRLMKANMATDIPDHARMTDEDIQAQVPTFLIAGHETTSVAVAWALYALACHPTAYAKLTAEARAYDTDTPSMDELNRMTYLDYVTREALRLHSPAPNTTRAPTKDTVVPLSEPFIDRHGVKRHELRVREGDMIVIPILAIHRLKSLWGEDADEFKPERWEAIPEAVKAIPGVFGNLMTFITGAHACIGYRFAVTEMKAILFGFVRSFDFELAVPPAQITRKSLIVARPFLTSDQDSGPQLPLIIRPARSD
ncbi:cytochrome P450 [Russula emetica]|nr:cytochrome P450 [Russula emetica]